MCPYVPTAKAPPGVKAKFFTELQDAVSKVPGGDVLVLLGTFNTRVGRLEVNDDVWQGLRSTVWLSVTWLVRSSGVLCK